MSKESFKFDNQPDDVSENQRVTRRGGINTKRLVFLLMVSIAIVVAGLIIQSSRTGERLACGDYAPVEDYVICCQGEKGESTDCTDREYFKSNERLTIIVNQNVLQEAETPYLLCEKSDLFLPIEVERNNEAGCIEINAEMDRFVIRKEGFVPDDHANDVLTLLRLTAETLDSSQILIDITRLLAR